MTLQQTFEHSFASAVSDVVLLEDRAVVATGEGLVVIERGAIAHRLDAIVDSLVESDDGCSLLGVSAPIDPPAHFPMRRIAPPEESRRTRRIYRTVHPWTELRDLGIVPVEGWSQTFDGRYWPTFEGDDVRLYEIAAAGIDLRARHATFWPVRIERMTDGVWLETSSLGASHFERLSVPDLRVIEQGDIPHCTIRFPPETIRHSATAPSFARPIFSVDAAGIPRTIEGDRTEIHPVHGDHRIMTLDDRVVATLPAPTTGLAASGDRALFWLPGEGRIELFLVCLRTARVTARRTLLGAGKAGARIFGRDVAVWTGATLQVLRDVGDA